MASDKQMALEATYEVEGLVILMQMAVNKLLEELDEDSVALFAVRGLLHRTKSLNGVLMDFVSEGVVKDSEQKVRGYVPDALRLAEVH